MIPQSSREALLEAMERFDREQRDTLDWRNWQTWRSFKHAIEHEGRLYPVKQIISLATGTPVSSFSGGPEANTYVERLGFEVVPLHPEDGVLHYTGQGLRGDHQMTSGNLALQRSRDLDFPVYGFERRGANQYV